MGLSNTKTKTNQQSTSTQTQTPTVPSWIQTPYQDVAGRVQGMLDMDPSQSITAPTANQTSAWARAGQGSGSVTPGSITAGSVTPGLLSSVDIGKYMNPFTQGVIDTSVKDLDRARQMAIVGNSAASAGAGGNAWMGDRAGVADAETNRGFLDSVASLTANLRNTGFNNAQQGAMYDIGNRFDADRFNVSNQLAADTNNVSNRMSADQFNINSNRADTEMMSRMGADERAIARENNPQAAQAKQMALILALLNGVPIDSFTGQTSTGTGTSSGSQTTSDPMGTIAGLLGGAGGLLSGIGALGGVK